MNELTIGSIVPANKNNWFLTDDLFSNISESFKIREEFDKTVICLSVPGHCKDTLTVDYKDKYIIVKGEVLEKTDDSCFEQSFIKHFFVENLKGFDFSKMSFDCKHGVMTIEVPLKKK